MFQYSQSFFTTTNVGHFVPFTFTGKERDEETDFTYHGAPYFDAALLTSWMAVDPMSDKYPSLSSDNYCAWNPVKLVDPDGREWDPSSKDIVNQYENDLKDRLKEASGNDRKEIQSALDELEILSMSDQMYHVEVGEVKTPRARGETGWDYDNKWVSITLVMDYSLAEIGHEMKHAYQFEIGEISYGKVKGIQDLLFDFSDKRAAYNRGTALGGKSMADTQNKI